MSDQLSSGAGPAAVWPARWKSVPLTTGQDDILRLRYVEGKSVADTADILDIPKTAVNTRERKLATKFKGIGPRAIRLAHAASVRFAQATTEGGKPMPTILIYGYRPGQLAEGKPIPADGDYWPDAPPLDGVRLTLTEDLWTRGPTPFDRVRLRLPYSVAELDEQFRCEWDKEPGSYVLPVDDVNGANQV